MDWIKALSFDSALGLGAQIMAVFILVLIVSILVQLWCEYIDDGDTDNPFWLVHFVSVYIFQCTYLDGAHGIKHCYMDSEGGHGVGAASCLFTCVALLLLPLALMWVLLAIVYGWGIIIGIAMFCVFSVCIKDGRTLYKEFNKHAVNKDAHTKEGVKEAYTNFTDKPNCFNGGRADLNNFDTFDKSKGAENE